VGKRLDGKVSIVTGSSMGIGRACAERFAEEGASVIINGYPEAIANKIAAGIVSAGGEARYCAADVGIRDDLRRLIQFALDSYGRLDILMNNAITGESASLLEQDESEWDRVFDTSVKAAFLASKMALPHMIERGGGVIINTSSVHGLLAGRGALAYDSAKAALINLTRQIAVDYGVQGIRANALCPGRILTERKLEMLEKHPEEARRQQFTYPLGRPGSMREIANAALFLASDESSFVTGHALVVDGGLTAQLQDGTAAYVEKMLGVPPPR
jgi:NAD(P)-dependent dehydrogenase (short-subunit alcohol dehydrogenase family)